MLDMKDSSSYVYSILGGKVMRFVQIVLMLWQTKMVNPIKDHSVFMWYNIRHFFEVVHKLF
jgi:hypothetical protein